MKKRTTLVMAAVAALTSPWAFAHHSYARFDQNTKLTLQGTVKQFQWTNPHAWVQLLVKDPATGQDVEWSIETDSPIMLVQRGWTRKSVKPGDSAVAVVHPLKIKGSTEAGLESLIINGQAVVEAKQ